MGPRSGRTTDIRWMEKGQADLRRKVCILRYTLEVNWKDLVGSEVRG